MQSHKINDAAEHDFLTYLFSLVVPPVLMILHVHFIGVINVIPIEQVSFGSIVYGKAQVTRKVL